ncbi:hypothetical protein GOHSU_21_00050 [Gordonia hirsuta DSM 44140 = NBRC 16056]|uniref:LGFP repeat-containing protein n=1 Tax=Gordonia hirsuta DSM 44140 = NBRC 16056 TaxID=1121927 RepID=L7LBX0_9ACTN|nr:hypothetical protein [Gordonia hirsuta]GAC57513.1 hypothetical protein GOHSU_21_00050 [Gordonia hirsuta DSM 44140 = NBRC 16056]
MKTAPNKRFRGLALGVAAALGATLFLAPAAVADTRDDAGEAISKLQTQIGGGDGADKGFNSAGLGDAQGEVTAIEGTDGFKRSFTGGTIYWSEREGATVLYGAIDEKYNAPEVGGPKGPIEIGFPSASESDGPFNPGRQAAFAGEGNPKIYWTPENGAWVVRGPFAAAFDKFGTDLGAPTGEIAVDEATGTVSQNYANGTLIFDPQTKSWTVSDSLSASRPDLSDGLAGLNLPDSPNLGLPGIALPSSDVPNASAAVPSVGPLATGETASSDWNKNWLWLLLLVPLLLALWYWNSRREKKIVHAPRPAAGANLPKVDVKAPGVGVKGASAGGAAASAGAAVAKAKGPAAKSGARVDETTKGTGDGIGTYVKAGDTVPVPVGAHLPLADPQEQPEGYPIKGNADSGRYHTPASPAYDETVAEIWFATEAAAKSAGFEKHA